MNPKNMNLKLSLIHYLIIKLNWFKNKERMELIEKYKDD